MKQVWNSRKENKGAAMILAICVMAVITVLCLSLLLISGIALSNAESRLAKEQTRVLAVTYSEQIREQIEASTGSMAPGETSPDKLSLTDYIWNNVNTVNWPYYNEEEVGHTKGYAYRTFQIRPEDQPSVDSWYKGVLSSLSLTMYWTSATNEMPEDSKLYVVVTAERNKQSSTITTVYGLSEGRWMMEGDKE